ncbi:MAG TPA: protoporphyrinogen oxidase [Aldersonia sp.]
MIRVGVIGGGISGLVAAHRLRIELGGRAEIAVFDAGTSGGQLRTVDLAGGRFDIGAEAFVARRPEVPALLDELGIADRLVAPAGRRPLVYADGGVHPLPAPTLMGIPAGPDPVAGLVSADTLARIAAEPPRQFTWAPGADVTVGALVRDRFGADVITRSVDPLLGGVYAGSADTTGLRAALPTLAAALDGGAASLSDAVRAALPPARSGPVFGAVAGGYAELIDALTAVIGDVRTGTEVVSLTRVDDGWAVTTKAGTATFDAVVLAVPPPALHRLTSATMPAVAEAVGEIDMSHPTVVALALPADAPLPDASGVLVATDAGLTAKAFTFSSRKWSHLRPDAQYVRVSFGRFGDDPRAVSEEDYVAAASADLVTVTGIDARPLAHAVQRWSPGIPQYRVGHKDVVARAIAALPDDVAVAGAWLDGVGVPACVASGEAAARRLLAGAPAV